MRIKRRAVRNTSRRSGWYSVFKNVLIGAGVFAAVLALAGSSFLYYVLLKELPSIAALKDYRPSLATRVYSDNNELVDEFFAEDRKIIPYADVPKIVIQAFVAAEDARFFHHKGFDLQSITRAFYKNLEAGKIVQGGSTITQQVAKLLYLSPEKSYLRKIKEAILAYKIDTYLTKEEILHLYLNHIYLGHGTYGIEAAAEAYFGKSSRHLTLSEAAILAGLPKAPTTYSPYVNYEKARQRQAYVLERMVEDRYISKEDREKALAQAIHLRSIRPKDKIAPYFVEHIRKYIQEKYGSDVLYREGLEVYTTLNIEMQKAARTAVEKGLVELEDREGYDRGLVQAALVCMEAKTGAVKALVGGRNFAKSEFNRAVQAKRQPGSAFKAILYTAAFDKGMTPSTRVMDAPLVFEDTLANTVWKPQNFDRKFHGPTTLRNALTHSRNIVTIRVLQEIGVDYAAAYAANMGISGPIARNLSMALGTTGVSLLDLVRAYGVLANSGKKVQPFFIRKIVDRTGHVFEETAVKSEQVIDPRIAFMSTYVLEDVVESGTGRRVKSIGRPVAAKTGTTDENRDAWFMGYTPSLVTGVWVGWDLERSLGSQEVGGRAAAPIWLYFMEKAVQGTPVETFAVPEGIVFIKVNPQTGAPAKPSDGGAIFECFIEGATPEEGKPIDLEEEEILSRNEQDRRF